jgi:class 3 adenylate cyclase
MSLYMDVHAGLGDATPDDVAEAHRHDVEIQDEFGVRFLSYWFSDPSGKTFCLVEAPDVPSLKAAHRAAHGLMPHEVIEVGAPTLEQFMGYTEVDENDRVITEGQPDTALRAIMFTDIEGSTASFTSVLRAVQASVAIQRGTLEEQAEGPVLAVKIGLTVGEPVEESEDLFGASVNLAARICAHAAGGQTLASSTVRDLAIGKGIDFQGRGAIGLKGFPDPVSLYEVAWAEPGA